MTKVTGVLVEVPHLPTEYLDLAYVLNLTFVPFVYVPAVAIPNSDALFAGPP